MSTSDIEINELIDIGEDPQLLTEQIILLLCGMIIYWGDGSVTESEVAQLKTLILNGEFNKIIDLIYHKDPADEDLVADETVLWSLETIENMKRESEKLNLNEKKLEQSLVANLSGQLKECITELVKNEYKGFRKVKKARKIKTGEIISQLMLLAESDGKVARRERKLIKLVEKNT